MAKVKGIKRKSTGEIYEFTNEQLESAVGDCRSYAKLAEDSALSVYATNKLIGADKIPVFSIYASYNKYDMVLYKREDEWELYEALVNNGPGEWDDTKWRVTSFYDYIRTELAAEIVKVRLIYSDNTPVVGANVEYYVSGVSKGVLTTDASGYISFSVPIGDTYTISPPILRGYIYQKPKTYTANASYRNIRLVYYKFSSDYEVITNEGTITTLDNLSPDQYYSVQFLVMNYSYTLEDGSTIAKRLIINVRGKHLTDGAITKKVWSNNTSQLLNYDNSGLPRTATTSALALSDYDGSNNTDALINCIDYYNNIGVITNLTVPAATWCRSLTVEMGNSDIYKGYLPSMGEIKLVSSNLSTINNYIDIIGGTTLPNINVSASTGRWWSSTQNSATNAWCLLNGLPNSFGKPSASSVLPLFDL